MTPMARCLPYLLVAVIAVGGCTQRPTGDAVGTFAVSLDTTATAVGNGINAVALIEVQAEDERIAKDIVISPRGAPITGLGKTGIVLTSDILKPRRQIFQAMSEYANALRDVSSGQQIDRFRNRVNAAGKALKSFTAETLEAADFGVDPTEAADGIEFATSAVNEFGTFLINLKLNTEIPKIIDQAQPILERVVLALNADFGAPDTVDGGFREILNLARKDIITARVAAIGQFNKDTATSKADVYELVLRSQQDIRELDRIDTALADVPPTLNHMLAAHAALRSPRDENAQTQIRIFADAAIDLERRFDTVFK